MELQATTTDEFLINEVYGEALKRINPYHNLLDENGEFDYFKYDNYMYECRLKMCYGHQITIGLTYAMSELYHITENKKVYLPEEFISMSRGMKRYTKENIIKVCEWLIEIEEQQSIEGVNEFYDELCKRFPMVVKAVEILGYKKINELKYNKSSIEKELLKIDIKKKRIHQGIIDVVNKSFITGASYPVSKVKDKLQKIFDEFEIEATAKSTDIRTYFNVSEYTGHEKITKKELKSIESDESIKVSILEIDGIKTKSVRKYKIIERKHNSINPYSTRTKHNLVQ